MQFKPDKNKSSAGDNKAKGLKEPDKVKPTLKEVEERLSQLAAEVDNESQRLPIQKRARWRRSKISISSSVYFGAW